MNIKTESRSAENEGSDIQRCVLDTFTCFPENEVSFFLDQVLRENATIPFIERYRKAQVQSLAPVDMREILETYESMEQTRKASLNFINKNRDSLLRSEVDILKGCVIKEELDNVKELVKSRTVNKWSDKESELFELVIYSVMRGEITSEDGILHRLRGKSKFSGGNFMLVTFSLPNNGFLGEKENLKSCLLLLDVRPSWGMSSQSGAVFYVYRVIPNKASCLPTFLPRKYRIFSISVCTLSRGCWKTPSRVSLSDFASLTPTGRCGCSFRRRTKFQLAYAFASGVS